VRRKRPVRRDVFFWVSRGWERGWGDYSGVLDEDEGASRDTARRKHPEAFIGAGISDVKGRWRGGEMRARGEMRREGRDDPGVEEEGGSEDMSVGVVVEHDGMGGEFHSDYISGAMVHDVLEYLRRESLDIYNRLHSIAEDAQFVEQVCREEYSDIPLVPNLRCGAWYSDPAIVRHPDTPAYFKSTDGHFSNWSFNLRRANLHLVPIVARYNG